MTDYRPCKTDYSPKEVQDVSFAVADSKGRIIGARVRRFMLTVTEIETPEESLYSVAKEFGTFYALTFDATRDNKEYGSGSAGVLKFRTAAEREAYVAKYLKGAAKRAEKTAAKGAR